MQRIVEVEPRSGYRVWVRFEDGMTGKVDFSDIAGEGVFSAWSDRALFEDVHIGPGGSLAWPGNIEICPDSTYLRLTEKSAEELFPKPSRRPAHA